MSDIIESSDDDCYIVDSNVGERSVPRPKTVLQKTSVEVDLITCKRKITRRASNDVGPQETVLREVSPVNQLPMAVSYPERLPEAALHRLSEILPEVAASGSSAASQSNDETKYEFNTRTRHTANTTIDNGDNDYTGFAGPTAWKVVPLNIDAALNASSLRNGMFQLNGIPFRTVRLYGVVREIGVQDSSCTFMLYDNTGSIEVKYLYNDDFRKTKQLAEQLFNESKVNLEQLAGGKWKREHPVLDQTTDIMQKATYILAKKSILCNRQFLLPASIKQGMSVTVIGFMNNCRADNNADRTRRIFASAVQHDDDDFGALRHQMKMCNLVCHLLGDYLEAVKKDFEKAARVFKNNCDDYNYPKSCHKYGNFMLVGRGQGKSNFKEAYKYFEKGCKLGEADACLNLGLMLITNNKMTQIDRDIKTGMHALEKACTSTNATACYYLSGMYISGVKREATSKEPEKPVYEIEKDMSKAYRYTLQGCTLGNMYSCANLSQMYAKGEGTDKNTELAEKYKKIAIEMQEEVLNSKSTLTFQEGLAS